MYWKCASTSSEKSFGNRAITRPHNSSLSMRRWRKNEAPSSRYWVVERYNCQTSDSFQSDQFSSPVPWPSARVRSMRASRLDWVLTTSANSWIVAGSSKLRRWATFESVMWLSTSRMSAFLRSELNCSRAATR